MVLKRKEVLLFLAAMAALALFSLPSVRERGLLMARSNQWEQAEPMLVLALAKDPHDWEVLNVLIELYQKTGQLSRALPLLQRKLAATPADEKLRVVVVDTQRKLGDVEGALSTARGGSSEPIRERYAALCAQVGALDEALGAMEELCRDALNAKDPEKAYDRLATIAKWQRFRLNYPGVINALERIAQLRPSFQAWDDLMDLCFWQGQPDQAQAAATHVEGFGTKDLDKLRVIREVRVRARDLPGAVRAAGNVCAQKDAVGLDWLVWANLESALGDPEATVQTLEDGLKRFPKDLDLLRRMSSLLYTQGRFDEAVPWITRLAKASGNETDALDGAYALYDVGRFHDASRLLAELFQGKEVRPVTRYFQAYVAFSDKDLEQAKALTEMLERAATNDPAAARLAANMWRSLGFPSRRADLLERARALQPDDPDLLLDYAQATLDAGRLEQTRVALEKLEHLPGADLPAVHREEARLELEVLYAATRQTPQVQNLEPLRRAAVTAVEAALKEWDNQSLMVALVPLYLDLGRQDDAIKLLAKIKNPTPQVRLAMATAFARMNELTKAREYVQGLQDTDFATAQAKADWAWLHLLLKEVPHAIELYQQALALEPDNDAVLVGLADAYGVANDLPMQQKLVTERALKLNTEQAWLDAASRFAWASQLAGEAGVLDQALQRHPNALLLWERRLYVLAQLLRFEDARAAWRTVQRLAGAAREELTPDVLLSAAQALQESTVSAEVAEAAALTSKVLGQARTPPMTLSLAQLLAKQKRWKEAETCYRKYLETEATQPNTWLELASVLGNSGQDNRAVLAEVVKRLDEMASPPPALLLETAASFTAPGDRPLVRRLMARLPGSDKLTAEELSRAGFIWVSLDLFKEALPCYEAALRLAPENDAIVLDAADAFGRAGDHARQFALMEARAARAQGAGGAKAWLDAANRRMWANDRPGQEQILARALAKYPDDPLLLANHIWVLAYLTRYREAREEYNRLKALGENRLANREVLAAAAEGMALLGDLNEAGRLYDRMLVLDPADPLPVLGLGRVEVKRDRYPQAVLYYQRYVLAVPGDQRGWYELGEALYEAGRDGRAAQDRALALLSLSDDPYVVAVYARVYSRQGHYQKGFALYEQALKGGVMDVDLACDYAYSLRDAHEYHKELILLRRALAAHPGAMRPRRLLATSLIRERQYGEAAELLRGLLRERPDDRGAASELGYAEFCMNRFGEAIRAYELAGRREFATEGR